MEGVGCALGSPFSPDQLQVSLLREQVADLLRKAIVDLRLKPGQRLVERELVQWTGVSRATIREAIRQLAAEGLVTSIPQKGAVVAMPARQEATELFELRAVLEGMVARRFVERAKKQHRQALRKAYEALRGVVAASGSSWQMLQAKGQFYEALFAGAGNTTISEVIRGLQARITLLRAASMSQPQRLEASLEEIAEIVEAIEQGDPAAAERASAAHVRSAERAALGALDGVVDEIAERHRFPEQARHRAPGSMH